MVPGLHWSWSLSSEFLQHCVPVHTCATDFMEDNIMDGRSGQGKDVFGIIKLTASVVHFMCTIITWGYHKECVAEAVHELLTVGFAFLWDSKVTASLTGGRAQAVVWETGSNYKYQWCSLACHLPAAVWLVLSRPQPSTHSWHGVEDPCFHLS